MEKRGIGENYQKHREHAYIHRAKCTPGLYSLEGQQAEMKGVGVLAGPGGAIKQSGPHASRAAKDTLPGPEAVEEDQGWPLWPLIPALPTRRAQTMIKILIRLGISRLAIATNSIRRAVPSWLEQLGTARFEGSRPYVLWT